MDAMSKAGQQSVPKAPLVVVMGVSGSGKTLIGQHLAAALRVRFLEGDSLHPESNIQKMSSGIPLNDGDRLPWLALIGKQLAQACDAGTGLVASCSGLRKVYRDCLRGAVDHPLSFVFLNGSRKVIENRLAARVGHFMPPSLLDSQFAALEDPSGELNVRVVDIDASPEEVVERALNGLSTQTSRT